MTPYTLIGILNRVSMTVSSTEGLLAFTPANHFSFHSRKFVGLNLVTDRHLK